MRKLNIIDRAATMKVAQAEVLAALPERAERFVKMGQPTFAFPTKLRQDLNLAGLPGEALYPFETGVIYKKPESTRVVLSGFGAFANLAGAMLAEEGEKLEFDPAWGLPQVDVTDVEVIRSLLMQAGATEVAEEVYVYQDMTFNLKDLTINGHGQTHLLLVGAFGGHRYIKDNPVMVMYMRLSMAMSAMASGNARDKFRGILKLSTNSAEEHKGLGYSDPASHSWKTGKVGVIGCVWSGYGFRYAELALEGAELVRWVMEVTDGEVTSHNQGKYFILARSAGILVKNGKVFSVGNLAKAFARRKQATPTQMHLVKQNASGTYETNFDVSYFRNLDGSENHGRRCQVLAMPTAISLPYLGAAVNLVGLNELGKLFASILSTGLGVKLSGIVDLKPMVSVGDEVEEGTELFSGYVFPITASRKGTVMSIGVAHDVDDKSTTFHCVVGELDISGQGKGRGPGQKWSFHDLGYTGIDWTKVQALVPELANLGVPSVTYGDTAVWGLNAGDKPVFLTNEDGNKWTDSGDRQGFIAMASDTTKTHVTYDPEADISDAYQPMLDTFEKKAARRVVVPFSVDADTYAAVEAAMVEGMTEKSIICRKVEVEGRMFYLVIQTGKAYMVEQVVKLECLPVSASVSTGRIPGMVAVSAKATKHLDNTSTWLFSGRADAKREFVKLLDVASAKWENGKTTLKKSGTQVPTIRIAGLTDGHMAKFAQRAQDPLSLANDLAIVDDSDGTVVVLSKDIFEAYGMQTEEGGMLFLVKCLFGELSDPAFHSNAKRTLKRLRACFQGLATSGSIIQSFDRGVRTVQAKSRAGYVRRGWIALSIHGSVLKLLCKQAGLKPTLKNRLSMIGRWVAVYRAPQVMPLFVRIYCPDVAQEDFDRLQAQKRIPADAVRYQGIMELDTFAMNCVDIAFDNGDKDGDGRNLVILPHKYAIYSEVLAWSKLQYDFRTKVVDLMYL